MAVKDEIDITDWMIRKYVNKKPEDFKVGDKVIYVPKDHLLLGDSDKMTKEENLGIVTSVNDTCVFVKYNSSPDNSQATNAEDLFWINNRPDLIEKLKVQI